MSLIPVRCGPFQKIFIGNADDTDVLTEVFPINTDDNEIADGIPTTYFKGINRQLQTGVWTVVINLKFYGDDLLLWNLTKGRSVANTNRNASPGMQQYTLLCIEADETSDTSIYLPSCRTERVLSYKKSKRAPSVVELIFTAEDRSVEEEIVTYNTPDELDLILGIRSPL